MSKRFNQNFLIVMIEKLGKPLDSTREYAILLTYKSFWCLASWPDYCWTLKFGFLFPSVWLINKELNLTWTLAKLLNVRSLKVQCLIQLLCRIFFVINEAKFCKWQHSIKLWTKVKQIFCKQLQFASRKLFKWFSNSSMKENSENFDFFVSNLCIGIYKHLIIITLKQVHKTFRNGNWNRA